MIKKSLRRTPEEIQRILKHYPSSGLSKTKFCQQYKISENALYKWIKLNKEKSNFNFIPVAIRQDCAHTVKHEDETKDNFINNKILDHNEIKIEINAGIVVKVPSTISPNWLSSFIKELQ